MNETIVPDSLLVTQTKESQITKDLKLLITEEKMPQSMEIKHI